MSTDARRARRPGGRTARVRAQVLAAALALADRDDAAFTIGTLAAAAGVNEVTIYRRWGSIDAVLLEAIIDAVHSRNPLQISGDLRADLTRWAEQAERDLDEPRGRRLVLALARASADATLVRSFLEQRYQELAALLAAAQPATTITVEDVLDRVLAPLHLRHLMRYDRTRTPAELVADLLGGGDRPVRRPRRRSG